MDLLALIAFWFAIPIAVSVALIIECIRQIIKLKKLDKESLVYKERKKSFVKLIVITLICAVITIDWYLTNLILQKPLFHM